MAGKHGEDMYLLSLMECVSYYQQPADNILELKMGDMVIKFRPRAMFSPQNEIVNYDLTYLEQYRDIAPVALQNHVKCIFQNTLRVEILVSSCRYLTNLPILENVKTSYLKGSQAVASVLEEFLFVHNNQECVHIVPFISGNFNRNSEIFSIPKLYCKRSGFAAAAMIPSFTGNCLILEQAKCDTVLLIQLLRKWVDKTAYQNLKMIRVSLFENYYFPHGFPRADVNLREILKDFKTKRWDRSNRPQIYELDPQMVTSYVESVDCSQFLDIEQEGGGKLGSVFITHDSFEFYVWDGDPRSSL
ncbi:hypothetical protein CRE_27434 [Caenorhabditis remanei]|uniref:F-box associated domain-containing protein n=1 Tax=Caenorhabditis remanei TaxID=31234 RepID=E3LNL2_CAERE|nr:hypothetical protein CRE_27434 [Caenorhabditis remanei]